MVGLPFPLKLQIVQLTFYLPEILPLIRLGMDSPTHSLADVAIKCLPIVLPVLDFSTVKNEVFPPIATTFSRTSSLAIKVRCLDAFTVLCGGSADTESEPEDDLSGVAPTKQSKPIKSSILDKYTIQEKLVPSLKVIKTKEPAVMMAALNVFRQVGIVGDTDFLALEVLPILWSFSLGPLLDLRQFEQFMTQIKNISAKIEREQKKKLQELSSGDTSGFRNGTKSPSVVATLDQGDMNDNFERLVLGKGATPSDADIDAWDTMDSGPTPQTSAPAAPPSFSWSTSNAPGPVSRGSTPAQSNPNFRSVTPDYNISSFPSLEPAPRQVSPMAQGFPALRPSPSGSWSSSTSQRNVQGNTAGPSLAALASMKSASSTASTSISFGQSNYSAFSIPPPPASGSIPPQPSAFGGASNAAKPPPLGANVMQNPLSNTNTFEPVNTEKQGLDKYESLI